MTLQHLDSAIAFAVIMLGASLLITILTQFISTLLNLRGKDLQRALSDLVRTLRPGETEKADALAREILRHPLLSEARFGALGENAEKYRRLVAAAVGVVAFFTVLVCARFNLSAQVASLGAAVAAFASYMALQASKFTGLASALRITEFREMLRIVGATKGNGSKTVAAEISKKLSSGDAEQDRLQQVLALTEQGRATMEMLAKKLRSNDEALNRFVDVMLAAVGNTQERKARLEALKTMVRQDLHAVADQLSGLADAEVELEREAADLAAKIEEAAESKLKEVEILFNAAMDRASQRFSAHSRLWTVGFSIALAFLIHLDAIALFKKLSSDAELRAKLVASSDAMMKQADEILAPKPAASNQPSAAPAPSNQPSAAPAPSSEPAAQPPPTAEAATPSETAACVAREGLKATVPSIYVAAAICPQKLAGLPSRQELGPFPTRDDALDYLQKVLPQKERDAQIDVYRQNLNKLLQGSEVSQLFDNAASINGQLSRAGIDLLPEPYVPRLPTGRELPGVLAAAAMLSLGAPFWFNLLKTMTNLRPLVATREENDRKAKTKTKAESGTA